MRLPLWDDGGVIFAPSRVYDQNSFPSAGGVLVGSAPDVLSFFHAIMTEDKRLLLSNSIQNMLMNQLPAGISPWDLAGWGFGYGWAVLTNAAEAAPEHLPDGLVRSGQGNYP
jgi:CubicO group peptidase (beta-lactamase class C family)